MLYYASQVVSIDLYYTICHLSGPIPGTTVGNAFLPHDADELFGSQN